MVASVQSAAKVFQVIFLIEGLFILLALLVYYVDCCPLNGFLILDFNTDRVGLFFLCGRRSFKTDFFEVLDSFDVLLDKNVFVAIPGFLSWISARLCPSLFYRFRIFCVQDLYVDMSIRSSVGLSTCGFIQFVFFKTFLYSSSEIYFLVLSNVCFVTKTIFLCFHKVFSFYLFSARQYSFPEG